MEIIPAPSVNAPPYNSIIPQGTLLSISSHLTHPVTNSSILPSTDITPSPKDNDDENIIQNATVIIRIPSTVSSLILILP